MTKRKPQQGSETAAGRYDELQKMLMERQRELLAEVQGKVQHMRSRSETEAQVQTPDIGEIAVQDANEDLELAMIRMKEETLNKINDALARLEAGTYGNCFECGDEIAHPRLRALPFAVRCKKCEEDREITKERDRAQTRRGSVR